MKGKSNQCNKQPHSSTKCPLTKSLSAKSINEYTSGNKYIKCNDIPKYPKSSNKLALYQSKVPETKYSSRNRSTHHQPSYISLINTKTMKSTQKSIINKMGITQVFYESSNRNNVSKHNLCNNTLTFFDINQEEGYYNPYDKQQNNIDDTLKRIKTTKSLGSKQSTNNSSSTQVDNRNAVHHRINNLKQKNLSKSCAVIDENKEPNTSGSYAMAYAYAFKQKPRMRNHKCPTGNDSSINHSVTKLNKSQSQRNFNLSQKSIPPYCSSIDLTSSKNQSSYNNLLLNGTSERGSTNYIPPFFNIENNKRSNHSQLNAEGIEEAHFRLVEIFQQKKELYSNLARGSNKNEVEDINNHYLEYDWDL